MENFSHGDVAAALGDDHIATVEIRRGPENYIDVELARDLADVIVGLDGSSCRAIVLTSQGKHFCAGARLSGNAGDLPEGDNNPLYEQTVRLFEGAIPIVAAVQGAAIGAGLGVALAEEALAI